MKELIKITGQGKMSNGCDIYPKHSVHFVQIDKEGIRWTRGKRDAIHQDISSDVIDGKSIKFFCDSCNNYFTEEAKFYGKDCERCYKRKNGIPRD